MAYGDLKVRNLIWNTGSGDNTIVLSTLATTSSPTFTGTINGADLVLSGNLTVNGTQTIINTQTLDVEDKQIEIGKVSSPSDTTADLGGWKLKGATDKTFLWLNATDSWTSSEHIEIASGKNLKVDGTTFFVDGTTNRVGIGITSPLKALHVKSTGAVLRLETTATTGLNYIDFNDADENKAFIGLGSGSNDSLSIWNVKNDTVRIGTNNTERMRIDSSGRVGINETGPAGYGNFVVKGTGNIISLNASSGNASLSFFENGTGRFYIKTLNGSDGLAFVDADNSSERLRIGSSGQLGIGGATYGSSGQVLTSGGASTAPSWTTISAAPEVTATADGAIAANKPVRVNEDGTISEIKNTALSAATGSNTDIPHQYDPIVKASVWISSTKFVLFWIADDNSDKLNAAVGTASGTSITYGSRIEVSSDTSVLRVSAVYDSSIDVILLTYNTNPSGVGGGGTIKGLTVSGTTITVNGTGGSNGDASHTVDIASDNKGGFIQMWVNKDQQWFALAGTVTSAGAISTGSALHIANSRTTSLDYNTMRMCYDKDSDTFVGVCRFNNNTDYSICTRSGTTVTENSASTPPTIISGTDNSNVDIVYFETEQRFLITSRANAGGNPLKYATPKMNVGKTALNSGGSGTLFAAAQDNIGFLAYDKVSNKAFYIFADDTNSDTKLLTITLSSSGTVTGTGSVTSEQLSSSKEIDGLAVSCNGEGLVLTGVDKSDNSDVLSRLKQLAVTVSNLKGDSFIGFSSAAISDSASGTVGVVGNTATQSGLTPSKKYYVQKGGTVSTAADDPSVVAGIALSSTKLLIKG